MADLSKTGIHAHRCHMPQFGIDIVEFVDFFHKLQNAVFAVRRLQRGEFHAVQQELLHFFRVILLKVIFQQVFHLSFHLFVIEV